MIGVGEASTTAHLRAVVVKDRALLRGAREMPFRSDLRFDIADTARLMLQPKGRPLDQPAKRATVPQPAIAGDSVKPGVER